MFLWETKKLLYIYVNIHFSLFNIVANINNAQSNDIPCVFFVPCETLVICATCVCVFFSLFLL